MKRVVESRIPLRLLGAGLWVVAAIVFIASVVEETRARCVPGQTRGALIALAALSAGVATCLTLWRPGRAARARAIGLGIAVALGVAALLFALGLLSWVHDCAN